MDDPSLPPTKGAAHFGAFARTRDAGVGRPDLHREGRVAAPAAEPVAAASGIPEPGILPRSVHYEQFSINYVQEFMIIAGEVAVYENHKKSGVDKYQGYDTTLSFTTF